MRTSLREELEKLAQRLEERGIRDITYSVQQAEEGKISLNDSRLVLVVNLGLIATEYHPDKKIQPKNAREERTELRIAAGYVDAGYDYFEEHPDLVNAAYSLALVEVVDTLSELLRNKGIFTDNDGSFITNIEQWNQQALMRHERYYTALESQTEVIRKLPYHSLDKNTVKLRN